MLTVSMGIYSSSLSDLFNDPYAGRIPGLYDGLHSSDQINGQLTVTISGLFRAEYISGHATAPEYRDVREALAANSIEGWDSDIPILFMHGTADTYVIPALSERMYDAMTAAGSSPVTCTYLPMEGFDHSGGIVPAGLAGLEFFSGNR